MTQSRKLSTAMPDEIAAHRGDSRLIAEPGSYRDRNGAVFYRDGAVYRGISQKSLANFERLSAAPFFRGAGESGEHRRAPSARRPER